MSTENAEFDREVIEQIGMGSAVMQAIAFTAVGYFALESLVFGAITGFFAGVGSFLFLPWFLGLSAVQEQADEDIPFSEVIRRADGNPKHGIVGFGMDMGGILMLVVGFAFEDATILLGTGVAVATTLAVYLVGSILLDISDTDAPP